MIKEIISVANNLDKKGLTKEADILDQLLVKISQMAEEISEENSESDNFISAITTVIDKLSRQPENEENSKKIEMLSSLLEENL